MLAKKKIGTWNGVPVYTDFLPIGTRRTGQRLDSGEPKFAVFHDTGNKDTSAQQNVNYFKNTYNIDWNSVASAHIFVDDVECIICIPVTEKAWHVIYNTTQDNYHYGDDANDIAFSLEASYFTSKTRSKKSLDNACRIMAALCNSWKINPKTHMPGHQNIQSDKQDPGNLLIACGYKRSDMKVIDDLVIKYMEGDAPVKKVAKEPEEKVESAPKKNKTVMKWSDKAHYKGVIQYDASLRSRKGSSLNNYSFGKEVGIVKKGITVYIFEEIQDAQGNIWCRTYSGNNNGWVHKDTIKVTDTYTKPEIDTVKKPVEKPIAKKPSSNKNSTTKKYTVKRGDYLEKIAEKYDVSVNDIVKWNGLKSKNLIFVNQVLIVSKPASKKKPVKQKAPAKSSNVARKRSEMLARLNWYVGKFIDFDNAYAYQCADVSTDYVWYMTKGTYRAWGNARDLINNKFPEGWKIYQNTTEFIPKVGDIAVFTRGFFDNQYGHVGLVYANPTQSTVVILEQNWNGQANMPCTLRTDDYSGISHFIRPHYI